ncbi:MAG: hypothetical protein U0231_09960 [Nitrospiraceae bacterium]
MSPYPILGKAFSMVCLNRKRTSLVIEEMARKMLTSPNATIFPGPLVLWVRNEHAVEKAKAVLEIAAQIPDVMIIPTPTIGRSIRKSIRKK